MNTDITNEKIRSIQEKREILATLLHNELSNKTSNLSLGQQRLWFLNLLTAGYPAQVSVAYKIHGNINYILLVQCINDIALRHEMLRTTFIEVDGRPLKIVSKDTRVEVEQVSLSLDEKREEELQRRLVEETLRPFQLTTGPLARVKLFNLLPGEQVLLVSMHNMIADKQSLQNFLHELTTLYQNAVNNDDTHLPELPIKYTDYVIQQRDWLQSEEAKQQFSYWKQQLVGSPAALDLPTDYPRPAIQSFHGAACTHSLSTRLGDELRQLGQLEDVNMFTIMLTAFQLLLARYSRQEDIVVGSFMTARKSMKLEPLIGPLLNTVALRTDLSGNPSFRQALQRVQNVCSQVKANQDMPFEQIVEALQPERNLSRSPLFQVAFTLDDHEFSPFTFDNMVWEPLTLETKGTQYDLSLEVTTTLQGLQITLLYNTDLFEEATIQRMLQHYEHLLQEIVEAPETPSTQISLLSAEERTLVIERWALGEEAAIPSVCIHELFERQVALTPQAIALQFEGEKLSYTELNKHANQLAHYLRSQGVGPEVLVGVCLERSLNMIVGLFGILKAGGAYVPLDPNYPQERLAFMLQDADIHIVLSQQSALVRLPHKKNVVVVLLDQDWDQIQTYPEANVEHHTDPAHLAYVLYTSGSTGTPKGVMIHHHALVNYLQWCTQAYETEEKGSLVHSPLTFDLTITGLYTPLLCGHTITLVNEEKNALSIALNEGSFSFVKLTPAHLELLSQWLPSEAAATATAHLVIGGEALVGEMLSYWKDYAPETQIINEYGPTETVVGCCVYKIAAGDIRPGAVPIGHPIANVNLYVLDDHLQPTPIGVPGELYIGGAGLARGYMQRPDLTAERFLPHPFSKQPGARIYRTGDLVRYRSDGCLDFIGRVDHQVKIRGYRIELGEIEAALRSHASVKETILIVREDQPGERRLVAYIVPVSSDEHVSTLVLREHLQQRVPEYMIPAAFVLLEALPLTSNGKVDRKALPAPSDERPDMANEYVAPRTPMEHQIAEAFAEVLGLEKVGIHDNFFELGAHSLNVAQLSARMAKIYHVNPPVQQFFEVPTIAGIAHTIEAFRNATSNSSENTIHTPKLEAEAMLDETITPEGLPWADIMNPSHIFLTGVTGFLGAFILDELLRQTSADIYCLVRAKTVDDGRARIQSVMKFFKIWDESYRTRIILVLGDLTKPLLGLSEQQFNTLARVIDAIYHSGAKVNFIYPYSALKPTNVLGTQEVLRLACTEKVKVVHHVSALDVFVSKDQKDHLVKEEEPLHPGGHPYGYVQSKWVGEKLVSIAKSRGLPTCIYRPWLITGHSKTGATHTTDLICVVLKGSVQLGVIADDGTNFNVMPVDYVSSGLVYLSRQQGSLGKIFHFANQHTVPVREVFKWLENFGYPLKTVSFQEWREHALNVEQNNALYSVAPLYREQTEYPEFKIDCTNTLAGLQDSGIVCPQVNEEHIRTCLSYLIDIGFLEPPQVQGPRLANVETGD